MSKRRKIGDFIGSIFFDNMGWFREPWIILSVLLICAALAAGLCWGTASLERVSCSQKGDEYGLPSNYRFLSGCYLTLPDGRKISPDNIQNVELGQRK